MSLNGALSAMSDLSSDLFQQIIDNTSAVIYVKDRQFRYLHVNQQYEWFSRLSRCEIVGNTDFDLFSPELARGFRILQVFSAGFMAFVSNPQVAAALGTVFAGPPTFTTLSFSHIAPDDANTAAVPSHHRRITSVAC